MSMEYGRFEFALVDLDDCLYSNEEIRTTVRSLIESKQHCMPVARLCLQAHPTCQALTKLVQGTSVNTSVSAASIRKGVR